MSDAHHLTPEQYAALIAAGVLQEQFAAFLSGAPIAYALPTEGEAGVAVLQLAPPRLRSGIVVVKDGGSGVKCFARFRGSFPPFAVVFGLS